MMSATVWPILARITMDCGHETQACMHKLLAGVQFMATSATNNNNFIFPRAPLKKEYMMFHRELVSFDSINNFIFTERSI